MAVTDNLCDPVFVELVPPAPSPGGRVVTVAALVAVPDDLPEGDEEYFFEWCKELAEDVAATIKSLRLNYAHVTVVEGGVYGYYLINTQ
jgi:hypothetical protein